MKTSKLIIFFGVVIVLAAVIYFPGRKLARVHVNNKTAVKDHPLSCISCHLYTQKTGFISKMINEKYLSPFNMAISKNGILLYVIAQDSNELLVVNTKQKKVINKIEVGIHPHSVILSSDEKIAYVSNEWSDTVSVIDLETLKVVKELKTGNGPAGLSLSANGQFLYVVNCFGSDLSVINLTSEEEINRLTTGDNPTGTALSPNGKQLYITSRRPNISEFGEPMVSEITVVDDNNHKVSKNIAIKDAYMMENVAFTPSGDLALLTLIRPKNMVPAIQVEGGWMMTNGIGIVEQKDNGKLVQLLLDEENSYYPDPFDIVVNPNGKNAYVSSTGVNTISVINLDSIRNIIANTSPEVLKRLANNLGVSKRFVTKRIQTKSCPKGLTVSSDGKLLYVAEQLEDKIAIIDTESNQIIDSIDLGGPKNITVARKGRRLFTYASHTFQNQYACYTCHPDYHEDGIMYNFAAMGRNITNTMSLRDIAGTAPFKWSGKNQSVYKQDGMRFSKFLTRTEAFNYEDLDALVAFIKTGIKYPPNLAHNPIGKLTESQQRGKEIFNRTVDNLNNIIPENNRCYTCHPAPNYTDLKLSDVGSLSPTDDPILFDTPSLNNIYNSAPYLHDGRAKSLEEIWTVYGGDDRHGRVNDLSKIGLNDLVNYLKSIRGPKYEAQSLKTHNTTY